jgi:hypothetical protein
MPSRTVPALPVPPCRSSWRYRTACYRGALSTSSTTNLPADYTAFTTNKTAGGFTVNIQPRLAANSVAAGVFNLQVSW